jgi:hypothetical protein
MLDLAYDDIESNGMMPEEFENKDIPEFSLRLNVPRLPADTKKSDNRKYDHYVSKERKHSTSRLRRKRWPISSIFPGTLIRCGSITHSSENSPSSLLP